jgi:tripartite-type tricarboxylate transporter receptor subunit TctC
MGPHLSKRPVYHPVNDYTAITMMADVPFVMVVPPKVPAKSVQEFIALAKKSKDKLSFASVGQGTPQHLAAELFKMQAKVDLVHVPFKGATAVLPDLLAGRIDMFIGAINSLLPLIKDGQLRALAASGNRRIASMPDLPTMADAGLPEVDVNSGVGLVAPAKTPPEIVATLYREITAITSDKGYHARMEKIGVEVVNWTPEAYAKFLREDYEKWGRVAKAAGIEPQ